MSEKQTKPDTKVELSKLNIVGEMELPKYDVTQHEGKKVAIKNIEAHEHPTNGTYLRITTESVDTIEREGEEKPIYASDNFGLVKKVDEKTQEASFGWGSESKLATLLKKYDCKHFNDLIGKKVMIVVKQREDMKVLSFV